MKFAEKLHAYTLPRQGRPNARVKDLVDLVLLSVSGTLDAARVTREHRGHIPPPRDASCARNPPCAPGSMAETFR
jgi:hypothetical protein